MIIIGVVFASVFKNISLCLFQWFVNCQLSTNYIDEHPSAPSRLTSLIHEIIYIHIENRVYLEIKFPFNFQNSVLSKICNNKKE